MTNKITIDNLPTDANGRAESDSTKGLQPSLQHVLQIGDLPDQFTVDVMESSGLVSAIDFAFILATPSLVQRVPQHLHSALKKTVSSAFYNDYYRAFESICKYTFRQDPSVKDFLRNFMKITDGPSIEFDTCYYQDAIARIRKTCEERMRSVQSVSEPNKVIRDVCINALLLSDADVLKALSRQECRALRNCLVAYLSPYLDVEY